MRSANRYPASAQAQFHISSYLSQAQDTSKAEPSNHERYTHFGYENVKEEEKEQKGISALLKYQGHLN
jgi:hypothetical protein